MLAPLDPRLLDRIGFPLGEQTKDETRAEAAAAGLEAATRAPRARRHASSPATTTATSSSARGSSARGRPIVDEDGTRARAPRRLLALHSGPAPGHRRRGRRAALRAPPDAGDEQRRRRPARARSPDEVARRGRLYAPVERVEAKLRYRSPAVPAHASSDSGGFRLELDEPAYGVAEGQAAVLYDGDAVVGAASCSSDAGARIGRDASSRLSAATSRTSRSRSSFPRRARSRLRASSGWPEPSSGFPRLSGEPRGALPVINKVGESVDR